MGENTDQNISKQGHLLCSEYLKGTPQYLGKIGKSLLEYLILQGCSEIVFSIKIQNTSISQAKRYIKTEQLILPACLRIRHNSSFSQLVFHYPEHVNFSGKNAPQNTLFYRAASNCCFRYFSVFCSSDTQRLNARLKFLIHMHLT